MSNKKILTKNTNLHSKEFHPAPQIVFIHFLPIRRRESSRIFFRIFRKKKFIFCKSTTKNFNSRYSIIPIQTAQETDRKTNTLIRTFRSTNFRLNHIVAVAINCHQIGTQFIRTNWLFSRRFLFLSFCC